MDNGTVGVELSDAFVDRFDKLYDQYVEERFKHALPNLVRALNALLDGRFLTSQRVRLRVEQGRIKSPNRLLLKAQTVTYRPKIQTPEDVFTAIRDIVGTRVTCNTVSDAYAVVDAIKSCATSSDPNRTLLKLHDDWEDDYIRVPKDSGYRAINLIVGVAVPRGPLMEPVTCEIQIRTLLQHAWGELTHEDTYKPGVKVRDLVRIMSKRLATTLAVLDEIAQDLRSEFDKVERLDSQGQSPAENVPISSEAFGEPPHAPELAQPQEAPAGRVPPVESATPAPVEQIASLSPEDLNQAYQSVFGSNSSIPEDGMNAILAELHSAGLTRSEQVVAILTNSRQTIEEMELQYDKVKLTDLGRLRAAVRIAEDMKKGKAWIADVLQRAAAKAANRETEKQSFEATYPDGKEALGTVVFATSDYALVQLPEGDTGILHATQMKAYPGEFVTVNERVREGDTVRVKILKTDPDRRRIELQFIK